MGWRWHRRIASLHYRTSACTLSRLSLRTEWPMQKSSRHSWSHCTDPCARPATNECLRIAGAWASDRRRISLLCYFCQLTAIPRELIALFLVSSPAEAFSSFPPAGILRHTSTTTIPDATAMHRSCKGDSFGKPWRLLVHASYRVRLEATTVRF